MCPFNINAKTSCTTTVTKHSRWLRLDFAYWHYNILLPHLRPLVWSEVSKISLDVSDGRQREWYQTIESFNGLCVVGTRFVERLVCNMDMGLWASLFIHFLTHWTLITTICEGLESKRAPWTQVSSAYGLASASFWHDPDWARVWLSTEKNYGL